MSSNALATACRVALLTPVGRGAVATISVEGPDAASLVAQQFHPAGGRPLKSYAPGRIVFGRWGDAGGGEELIVRRRSSRRVDVHCHGGHAAAETILRTLAAAGCREVDWRAWCEAGEADAISAEARIALAGARSERAAAVLLSQYRGALRAAIEQVIGLLQSGDARRAAARLEQLDRYSAVGARLVEPWRIVVAGRPNVGKSSLINAILGYQRCIVHDQPGATRDVVTAHTALNGWPAQLADTAGLRVSEDAVESEGVALALDQLAAADLAVLTFDAAAPWSEDDQALLRSAPGAVIVHNKCDLCVPSSAERPPGLLTSALTGEGVAQLVEALAARLPEAPLGEGVPFTPRQIEAVRAALAASKRGDLAAAAKQLAKLF